MKSIYTVDLASWSPARISDDGEAEVSDEDWFSSKGKFILDRGSRPERSKVKSVVEFESIPPEWQASWTCFGKVERHFQIKRPVSRTVRSLNNRAPSADGWIVEAINITSNGNFGLIARLIDGPPDKLNFNVLKNVSTMA